MFKDVVKDLMALILEDIKNLSLDSGLLASITRDDVYSQLWSQVSALAAGVFRTLALSVLAIFMLIEFLELSDRFSSNQLPDLMKPIGILVAKLALAITIINQSTNILHAVYDGFLDISKQITMTSSLSVATDLSAFNTAVDDMSLGTQVVCMLVLFIAVLGTKIACAFIQILTIGRFIQIYIYVAVAPAPIATLPNREWSSIGKGFLKSFVSICLQGCILVLILYFFPTIASTLVTAIIPDGSGIGGVLTAFANIFVMLGALLMGLKGAKTMADKICGVM